MTPDRAFYIVFHPRRGLSIAAALLPAGLITAIDAEALSPFCFHGWRGKRLTVEYGWRYDYEGDCWHRDRPVFDHGVGISIGASTTTRFRRRNQSGFDRAAIFLAA
jgi:hypothetical protein